MTVKYTGEMGTTTNQPPLCAKFPVWAHEKLTQLEDRSGYIRKAVVEQMRRDSLLSEEDIRQAIALGLLEE